MPSSLRVGIGHDTHRLRPGGPLRLGGVTIEFDHELVGHSDADVLLHAVADALLGAAALGDIGELFPDTEESNRGRDSAEILAQVASRVRDAGLEPVNVDCTVFAQRPKLSASKSAMASRIGEILGIPAGDIGIKAKTGEGVGTIGTGLVIEAQCVVLLERTAADTG